MQHFWSLNFAIWDVYYIVNQFLYCFKYLCNMKDCPRTNNFAEMYMLTNLPHATFLKSTFCDMRWLLYCKSLSYFFKCLCNMKDCLRINSFPEKNMLTNLPHATFLKSKFCDMRCILYCKSVSVLFQILV